LSDYYDNKVLQMNPVTSIERTVKTTIEGVPVSGKLDKLEFLNAKLVNIVDYKTGKPENAFKKMKGPHEKEPLGGDYWRQAVFYKLLMDNEPNKSYQTNSIQFEFVEPDEKKEYLTRPVTVTPEDEEIVRQQIKDTWERIQNYDFYTGCGKKDCSWCNFVKDNHLYTQLHDADDTEVTYED
jgi:DNA helicase II / ATP-dependent DNA helicase PcrA